MFGNIHRISCQHICKDIKFLCSITYTLAGGFTHWGNLIVHISEKHLIFAILNFDHFGPILEVLKVYFFKVEFPEKCTIVLPQCGRGVYRQPYSLFLLFTIIEQHSFSIECNIAIELFYESFEFGARSPAAQLNIVRVYLESKPYKLCSIPVQTK